MENENGKYFSRSWAMLTRDKGWIKPLLVLTAASLVPVAGALGIKGYALEWARLTAWGADAAPKQKNVDVGKCIGSGWRGFVVDLGLGLCFGLAVGIISGIVSPIPGYVGNFFRGIVNTCVFVVTAFFGVALLVAEVRASIYEKIGAGYRVDRVFQMISRDFNGFVKVFLVGLACYGIMLLFGLVFSLMITPMFVPLFLQLVHGVTNNYELLDTLSAIMVPLVLVCVILGFVATLLYIACRLITTNAVGLWMRQFDVPNWGKSEDPLPGQPTQGSARPAQPDQQNQQWQQGQQWQQYGEPQQPWQGQQEYPAQAQWQQQVQPEREERAEERPTVWAPPARVQAGPKAEVQPAYESATEPVPAPMPAATFVSEPAPVPEPEQEPADEAVVEGVADAGFEAESQTAGADTTAEFEGGSSVNDFYNDMMETIEENDRVDGD